MAGKSSPRQNKVVVVGGGISGLVTAKVLSQDGFNVELFEKMPNIGGVWAPSRSYPGLRANSPRDFYRFSDFPYPESANHFPTAQEVRDYLHSYVEHFGIGDRIHCSTEVLSVVRTEGSKPGSGRRFTVTVRSTRDSREVRRKEADHVVMCNGVFSQPYIPPVESNKSFSGRVIHSSDFLDSQLVAGKHVLVVGSGKSALDCATAAAKHGRTCTLVYRTPRWMIPRFLMGIRYDYLFFNRAAESLQEYHRKSGMEAFLHGPFKPFLRLHWRFQSWLVRVIARMPDELVPEQPLPSGLENLGVGTDFYGAVRDGAVRVKRDSVRSFAADTTVRLESGETLEADVVIFATGWEQRLDILEPELRQLATDDRGLRLFRHIMPPEEPNLGFVGYASTIANTLTSEMSAHWLSDAFLGTLQLPGQDAMKEEISRVQRWAERTFPSAREGYFIGPFIAHHVDELVGDMGLSTGRASNALIEYLGRFLPTRYQGVAEERRMRPDMAESPDARRTGA